jgi:hypothetical protein
MHAEAELAAKFGIDLKRLLRAKLFHPYAFRKQVAAARRNMRFVHYTSADVALNILSAQEVWMRKTAVMNDFKEIEHGLMCLTAALDGSAGSRLEKLLNEFDTTLSPKLRAYIAGWSPHFRSETYLSCMSEHLSKEDEVGRLSMWRAYGGANGVAIVVRNDPFLRWSDALGAYTSPVAYLSADKFNDEFSRFVQGLEQNRPALAALGPEELFGHLFQAFRFAVLCTKHEGFSEEREWRVIHSPTYEKSSVLKLDVVSVRGVPQLIYKLPLVDVPASGLTGITPANLVERIIIGPSRHPDVIKQAFAKVLHERGVEEPLSRIVVSDIPLRTVE